MSASSFAIVIPARFASTRFPGKPLTPLRGATGISKSLIQRSWECASQVTGAKGVWVATDDHRIADEVHRFGGQVVMTDEACENGTARCANVIERLGEIADIIVNLQGDAPLSPPHVVHDLVARVASDDTIALATPAIACSRSTYAHLAEDAANGRVGGTTVVCDAHDRALYFSKRLIPYLPESALELERPPVSLHLGMYAYRPDSLRRYRAAEPGQLELLEGLEQLRFLEIGQRIGVVRLDPLAWDSIELNNPTDVPAIERILAERGID